MIETEGVTKYRLEFEMSAAVHEDLRPLNVWRSILYEQGLIGQHAHRYGGYGYGNLSVRVPTDVQRFIISGTQTGHIPQLTQNHYVYVEHCDIANNHVIARGPLKPSSEALTHAMIYQLSASIQCVIHVHDPRLWQFGLDKGLPSTDKSVAYGTPDMATEVARLYRHEKLKQQRMLVMAGHEDGLICFADSIDRAGQVLIDLQTQAIIAQFQIT